MSYMDFEDLDVWKRAKALAGDIYKLTSDLKDYGFKDQLCRSAVSIASNIAEGAERGSPKEFVRFLRIAKGSAAELRTQLYIGVDIGYFQEEMGVNLVKETKEISSMLQGLIRSIER